MADTTQKLVARSERVMFMKISDTFNRMKGFTSLSNSKNAKEYSRQYVDEIAERSDVTGYSDSYDFAFDKYTNDTVLEYLADLIDNNVIGTSAVVTMVSVDFSKPVTGGGFEAKQRDYAVIGDTVGDSTDALTYSGSFKSAGVPTDVTASLPDGVTDYNIAQTVTVATGE